MSELETIEELKELNEILKQYQNKLLLENDKYRHEIKLYRGAVSKQQREWIDQEMESSFFGKLSKT